MLSPMVSEVIAPPDGFYYCDCNPDCVGGFNLPALLAEQIMRDKTLFLIVGRHPVPDKAGAVVKKGKGWKVYRQTASEA